jgi:excisionase family DNA binding protein
MSARPNAQTPSELRGLGHPKIALDVPDELVEVIAKRAAQLVLDAQPEQKWANVADAAERLRCPRSRVYELVSRGDLSACKDGTRLLFKVADLDAYLEASAS